MASDEKLSQPTVVNGVDNRQSPPKAIVDCSPLQPAINKNKEALKIKLMVRRPITQLVDQGIIPSLKSSPALHEQRKQLERAKTGDILKAKIQQRPDRQELERRHILEHDESHVDPSLAERQRMLKKARLADQLNSQLSHRPGPLELIKKNILHTEEPIERIVKEGLISFKATSEGLLNRPQQPNGYISYEDDSQSSEGDQQHSPTGQDVVEVVPTTTCIEPHEFIISVPAESIESHAVHTSTVPTPPPPPPPPLVTATITPANYFTPPPFAAPVLAKPSPLESFQVKPETTNLFAELCQSVIDNSTTLNFMAATPKLITTTTLPALSALPSMPSSKSDAPGKDKNRKKNKLKPIAKARTIKFHEYKGPPNAQKSGSSSLSSEETSYQLLLKQQNCLLEYLEGLNKNPSANTSTKASETSTFPVNNYLQQAQSSPRSTTPSTIPASPMSNFSDTMTLELSKLEKMKVSDLKLLLKTRNLPVSGPKPQLIDRLRPFIQSTDVESMQSTDTQTGDDDTPRDSPVGEQESVEMRELPVRPPPPPPPIQLTNENLLREQQRKIDELQRKLKESQQELHQMQMKQKPIQTEAIVQTIVQPSPQQPPKTEVLNQKQIFKQQLEAKIQKEKLLKLENLQKQQMELQRKRQVENNNLMANAVDPVTVAATPKPIIPTNNFVVEQRPQAQQQQQQHAHPPQPQIHTNANGPFMNHLNAKNGPELIWNGESTLLLVNFPDDKKILLPNNGMRNIFVPLTTSQNVDAILKKVSLGAQLHQPQQSTTVQLTSPMPKLSSHLHSHIQSSPIKIEKFQEIPVAQVTPPTHQLINCNSTGMVDILVDGRQLSVQSPFGLATKTNAQPCNGNGSVPSPQPPQLVTASTAHTTQSASPVSPANASKLLSNEFNGAHPSDMLLNGNMNNELSALRCHSNCDDMFLKQTDIFLNNPDQIEMKQPKKESMEHESNTIDMKTFDDLELMELMGQQLDMDIGDDSCQLGNDKLVNMTNSNNATQAMSCRRDMNPSLQPSLSELIQQQQSPSLHGTSANSNRLLNDSSNTSTTATNGQLFSDMRNLDSLPSAYDYNSNSFLDSTTSNNSNSLNLGSMDIEYFDNSLAQFDFAIPDATYHSNGLLTNPSQIGSNCSDTQMNHINSLMSNNSDSPSTSTHDIDQYYPNMGNTFTHNAMLDLFNIDDFKMTSDPMNWHAV